MEAQGSPIEEHGDERSTSEVIASLVANLQAVLRTQLELLKLEISGIARDKAVAIGLFCGAAVFGLFVLGFLGVTAATALALVLPAWAAWLIVTGVYLLITIVMALVGVRLVKRPVRPERTQQELESFKRWAQEQVQR
ncbi:MAG: phage holin family protein [Nitriliruptoraceae bacterium]